LARDEPESDPTTVNVVVPHPVTAGVASVPKLKNGSATVTESETLTSAFKVNAYVTELD
jgi:hypothetical protein